MHFEWDGEKAKINVQKHGITFNYALKVFDDENRLESYDYSHSIYEDRYNVLGVVDDVLFVVYTERDNGVIRLISARRATKAEEDLYYGNY